jgi:hypothetical protein
MAGGPAGSGAETADTGPGGSIQNTVPDIPENLDSLPLERLEEILKQQEEAA